MVKRYIDELFENLHKAEFERKDKHDASDAFLLAALSVLGSIALYYVKLFPAAENDVCGWVFRLFAVVYGILFTCVTCFVGQSVFPRYIAYISDPNELWQYAESLRTFFVSPHDGDEESEAVLDQVDLQLQKTMRKQYADAAARNRIVNQEKLKWQARARHLLALMIFVLLLNSLPTFIIQRYHKEPTNVKIENWNELRDSITLGSPPNPKKE